MTTRNHTHNPVESEILPETGNIYQAYKLSPLLTYQELENLLAYQIYFFDMKEYPTTYQVVNTCIKIIQSPIYSNNKKVICQNYMLYVFKSLLTKTITHYYKKIMLHMNKSLRGSYIDFSDVYQDLYVYFSELITNYDINSGVYFVTYLQRYLFYWGKNNFRICKKDMDVEISSLEEFTIQKKGNTGNYNQKTILDSKITNAHKQMSETLNNERDGLGIDILEDSVINRMVIWDFRKELQNYLKMSAQAKKNRRRKTKNSDIMYIYDYVYLYNQTNYSKLSRELGCKPQKVHYYIEVIKEKFEEYLSK
ncbi:MAG: hypothetical protein ABIK31_03910 [candidate division WOR-3 bacterium]